jgi:AraC-like DNA-binding protein
MVKPSTAVLNTAGLLKAISQHPVLPVIMASSHHPFPTLNADVGPETDPRRLSAYLLIYLVEGNSTHNLDFKQLGLRSGQLLLVQPNQIHQFLSDWKQNRRWYKVSFDEQSLALLPQSFDFLVNPLNNPILEAAPEEQTRLIRNFDCLDYLLAEEQPQPAALILAYLNVLLTELNTIYFRPSIKKQPAGEALEVYLRFRKLVEEQFTNQPPIHQMAIGLSVSENRLYTVVRQFAGVSPKTYLLNRTMLEAQRMFFYDRPSVKQVAYELGFNDPDHFSRAFKRSSGKTITQFLQDIRKGL